VERNPLFADLDTDAIEKILLASNIREFKEGVLLLEKGTTPEGLMLLCDGEVEVWNEDVMLATVPAQAVFGESLLVGATANATLKAGKQPTICTIRRDDFISLSREYPQLMLNLFRLNHDRLKSSNEKALEEARKRELVLEQEVQERTRDLNEALTDLQKTNEQLVETRDKLIETEKFRQQFLANMSHEIRTPMNAIVGLTNLLLKSQIDRQQDKYLNVISKSGSNLLVIINDILDLAKIEAGKMELEEAVFDLHNALHNVHTILKLKADEKGIHLDLKIDDTVPEYITGDETRLTQVIMNLTGNAIKFTEQGSVTISVSQPEGNKFRFAVRDTGIGIPADRLEKIFESFGQASADTTRKFGGTGLGLTISRQLVELHGGELKVRSTYGEGSEFYFEVELKEGEAPVDQTASIDIDPERVAALRILLVEDNEFNQMVAVDTMQDLFPGITVDVAENGSTALEKLEKGEYSFVFMDIQMPDMNGYETTRKIRSSKKELMSSVRICAMTANVTREEIEQCYDSGMDDYMMKPYTPEQLREKIIMNGIR
jgi:signal transduction histidine kinase/ActR/RegA family two-component response regulator